MSTWKTWISNRNFEWPVTFKWRIHATRHKIISNCFFLSTFFFLVKIFINVIFDVCIELEYFIEYWINCYIWFVVWVLVRQNIFSFSNKLCVFFIIIIVWFFIFWSFFLFELNELNVLAKSTTILLYMYTIDNNNNGK